MSDTFSDLGEKDEFAKVISTDELFAMGNPNPLGVPLFRHEQGADRKASRRLSLEGSERYRSTASTYSEELLEAVPTSLTRSTYGTLKRVTDGITITWRDLSVYVPQKGAWWKGSSNPRPFKRVLNNASGAVRPGTLVALMGSSGAGKSTLMNALAHRTPSDVIVDGDILVNGRRVSDKMSSVSGYVHQHDLFFGSLTVKEHLLFMARMRMDKKTSDAHRSQRVQELLKELGLFKSQNTKIGIPNMEKCISGGERKRLAFASEILTDPPLLFCDEPTTGLDSYNARKLVKMMKEMAARGKTIICTIHQPSSEIFALFDRLLLLSEGRIAFMGSSTGALEFFESLGHKCPPTFNPADFYIHTLAVLPGHELISRDRIKRICDNFAVSAHAKDIFITIQHQDNMAVACSDATIDDDTLLSAIGMPRKPGFLVQFYWLVWRSFVDSYRNPSIHGIRMLQKIMIALTVGVCYTHVKLNQAGIQDIEGAIFIFITENTFPSIFGVLNIFPGELPTFLREYKNGVYGCSPYYLAKMLSLIPGFILDPFIYTIICYWMVGLQRKAYQFFMTLLVVVFTANVSSACGAMFSATFESVPMMLLFLVPFDVVLFVSGGFLIKVNTMTKWTRWVRYLSWFLYSNEVLTVTQWQGIHNITCDLPPGIPCLKDGEDVIDKYSFNPSHLPLDFMYLLFLYFLFHLIGFFGLRRRALRK